MMTGECGVELSGRYEGASSRRALHVTVAFSSSSSSSNITLDYCDEHDVTMVLHTLASNDLHT